MEFTTVNAQLQNMKESDSKLSNSKDEDEASHFQMVKINYVKSDFQFEQLDETFEPRIASLFKQTAGCNVSIKTKLDLREVILLDIQLTMDLF